MTSEQVAEFPYRPSKCAREYRVVVVRKNLSVEKGDDVLFDDIRYFFYITNDIKMSAREVARFLNGFMALPTQVLTQARQIKLRVLAWTPYLEAFLEMFTWLREKRFAHPL